MEDLRIGVIGAGGRGWLASLAHKPAKAMKKYAPKVGGGIGLDINLTVKGVNYDREVFWPEAKNENIMNQPKYWGSVELVD